MFSFSLSRQSLSPPPGRQTCSEPHLKNNFSLSINFFNFTDISSFSLLRLSSLFCVYLQNVLKISTLFFLMQKKCFNKSPERKIRHGTCTNICFSFSSMSIFVWAVGGVDRFGKLASVTTYKSRLKSLKTFTAFENDKLRFSSRRGNSVAQLRFVEVVFASFLLGLWEI